METLQPKDHKNSKKMFEYNNTPEHLENVINAKISGKYKSENYYAQIGLVQIFIETKLPVKVEYLKVCLGYIDYILGDYRYLFENQDLKEGTLQAKEQFQGLLEEKKNNTSI